MSHGPKAATGVPFGSLIPYPPTRRCPFGTQSSHVDNFLEIRSLHGYPICARLLGLEGALELDD
ncbi:hypothetical protein HYR69_04600 [Candidatus Sumerlaeota bacterium]|nr:hypothetical protein [Candidatus Sumerlaeota bacterium]MBI3735393.1 hypothetical protein [Candidatus Sumerlaeota bacterium]